MKANSSLRLVAVIIITVFAVCSLFGCGGSENNGGPETTGEPQAIVTETTSAEPTAAPEASGQPIPDESDAPVYPVETNAPAGSEQPAASEQPGPDESVAPVFPVETAAPAGSDQPAVTPSPTFTAAPTVIPATDDPFIPPEDTPEPTSVPLPDPVMELTYIEFGREYFCDMDFDGKPDRIEVAVFTRDDASKQCSVKITLGSSGVTLMDSFVMDKYINGVINNFNTGDNRAELMLSIAIGTRDDEIRSYRINREGTGLLISLTEGWIDSVVGNNVSVAKYVDLMGTWECSCLHAFDVNEFELKPVYTEWKVKNEPDRWCTLSEPLLVGFNISGPENYVGFLESGDRLRPVSTDLTGRIDFITDTDVSGYVNVTFGGHSEAYIDGSSMDHWFSDLSFID